MSNHREKTRALVTVNLNLTTSKNISRSTYGLILKKIDVEFSNSYFIAYWSDMYFQYKLRIIFYDHFVDTDKQDVYIYNNVKRYVKTHVGIIKYGNRF